MILALLLVAQTTPVAGVRVDPFPLHTGVREVRVTLQLREGKEFYWAAFREGQPLASSTAPDMTLRFDPPLQAGERISFTVHVKLPNGRSVDDVVAVDVLNAPPEFKGADVEATSREIRVRPHFEDPEGDSLSITVLEPEGFVWNANDRTLTGPLPEHYPFTIKLQVSDGTNTVEVSIPIEKQP